MLKRGRCVLTRDRTCAPACLDGAARTVCGVAVRFGRGVALRRRAYRTLAAEECHRLNDPSFRRLAESPHFVLGHVHESVCELDEQVERPGTGDR
jgi:hypothetical protein